MRLRPYQQLAFDQTRTCGKNRVLNFLATGAGKSALFISYVKSALDKNKKVCLVMRRRQLVFQAADHFRKQSIHASVMMGSHKGFNVNNNFQICSIDTVSRRDSSFLYDYDLLILDEAHDAVSPKYVGFLSNFTEKTFIIGLTASPFPIGNKVHDFWTSIVKPIEMDELRDQGYLVPADTYVPTKLDLSKIKSLGGDYKEDDLAELMSQGWILGDIIDNYKKLGNNKPALCFCVNKSHSILMVNEFNKAGIPADHADESTPQDERDRLIHKLKIGEIKILSSINIFSTGTDIPEAEIGIMARPTKSEVMWVQMAGRLLRPCRICGKCQTQYDNSPTCPQCNYDKPSYIKEKAILIDHGQNTDRLGHIYMRRDAVTEKSQIRKNGPSLSQLITCSVCFLMFEKGKQCPNGCIPEKTDREIKSDENIEMSLYDVNQIKSKIDLDYEKFLANEKKYNYKPLAKWFKLYELHGDSAIGYKAFPIWVANAWKMSCPNKCKTKNTITLGLQYECQECKGTWTASGNKKSPITIRPDSFTHTEDESTAADI